VLDFGEVPGLHPRYRLQLVLDFGEVPGLHPRYRLQLVLDFGEVPGLHPRYRSRHGVRRPCRLPSYVRWSGDMGGPDLSVPIAPQTWCRWIVMPPWRILGCHSYLPGSRLPTDRPHFICRGMKWESAIRTAINIVPRRTAHRTPTTPTTDTDARPTPAFAVVCKFMSTSFL
jgi:hypothetical protein